MRAVEAREHEERRAEEIGVQGQAQVDEVRELEALEAHEARAEQRRHEEPDLGPLHVVALDGGEGQDHEERGHQEHEGAHRGERDVQDLVGTGSVDALALVREVGTDERAEEHALGAEEGPHPELPVVEPGDADVRVVVGDRVRLGHQ